MDWSGTLEEFIEIVDSLETNEFATVPPIEAQMEVQPIILNNNRSKLKISTYVSPVSTPTARPSSTLRDLVQRIEALEATMTTQHLELFELFSFTKHKLDTLEKIVYETLKVKK